MNTANFMTYIENLIPRLYAAGKIAEAEDFQQCLNYMRDLKQHGDFLKKQLETMERMRPLCPDCRDKCRGESCLRCQIQALKD